MKEFSCVEAIQPNDILEVLRRHGQSLGPFAAFSVSSIALWQQGILALHRDRFCEPTRPPTPAGRSHLWDTIAKTNFTCPSHSFFFQKEPVLPARQQMFCL